MASLNLSTNGPTISKTYQSVVNSPLPSGAAGSSSTYGQWALYSVHAPLANTFQPDSGKESVLKVQSAGEGELVDLIDDFSDGRIQFAYVKVKDPNTGLPKNVLIAWCGEGVPERTKGYFTSHLAAVSKLLHGYHVQVTARSDRDLTPESIMQKVVDASGSKYTGGTAPTTTPGPKPPVASKPAFTPTQSTSTFKPLGGARAPMGVKRDENVDEDGWGHDAPPVYRSQLEKVQPAYQPTKVNMAELSSQKPTQSQFSSSRDEMPQDDVVRGGYQPIGKVDIGALRRQAQETGGRGDDRPTTVKGAYEPVGKVDIAAIRAKAQPPPGGNRTPPSSVSPAATGGSYGTEDQRTSMADQSAAFSTSERLTSLPKPRVSNKFGGGNTFTGTKAPAPGGFDAKPAAPAAPVGTTSRTFADQGGKTPAQIWAEKKARERGMSASGAPASGYGVPTSPIASQTSGGGEWKSGYAGKSWAPVQITATGKSAGSIGQQNTGPEEDVPEEAPSSAAGGIGSIRDRFKEAPPMGAPATSFDRSALEPPPVDNYSKPNAGRGIPIPGLPSQPSHQGYDDEEPEHPSMPTPPPQPPRSPTPPTPEGSPIRVAIPVGRGAVPEIESARDEQLSPPAVMPTKSLEEALIHERNLPDDSHDVGRGAGVAVAAATFGAGAAAAGAHAASGSGGKRAIVQFDYEKAEDNEIELKEGDHVTHIEMVDEDWWMGENAHGETGLFPSNYVELIEDGAGGATEHMAPAAAEEEEEHAPAPAGNSSTKGGPTATAQFDYEAAEDNEISFPEGAKVTNLEFPDEDWWMGEYGGKSGLFPANYVQLDE